jgi:hypothetical protein
LALHVFCVQELAGRLEGGEEVMFDQLPALASGQSVVSGAASAADFAASELDAAAVRLSTQHQAMQLKLLMKLIVTSWYRQILELAMEWV